MKPNPAEAKKLLEDALDTWMSKDVHKSDLVMAISRAVGFLRGYELPPSVLARYKCSFCGVSGVKLWRAVHSDDEAWCSKCGMAQAGLPDTIDDEGMYVAEYSGRADGRSDSIYNPKKGKNLLPWVPAPDGETWGYTSVPPEGCEWWRTLPTRRVQDSSPRA